MVYLPMLMDRSLVSSNNLRRLTSLESDAERLLNSDGTSKSFLDVDNARSVIDAERRIDDIADQRKNNQYTIQRQNFQANQLLRAQEVLTKFRVTLSQTRSAGAGINHNFAGDIQSALELLEGVMNDTFGNEVPLSGTALYTDATVNLGDLSTIGLGSADVEDTSYYVGGPTGDNVYVDSRTIIDRAEINGSHACFEKLIRALRLAKSGDVTNSADPVFDKVASLLDGSNQSFSEAINRTGSVIENIKRLDDNLDQAAIQASADYKDQALTDNFESFELWQKSRSQLEISRNLTAFQAQESAQFIQRILS